MNVRNTLSKLINPDAITLARQAQSQAEYSLFIEKKNGNHARKELSVARQQTSRLLRENIELNRKLSKLGIK